MVLLHNMLPQEVGRTLSRIKIIINGPACWISVLIIFPVFIDPRRKSRMLDVHQEYAVFLQGSIDPSIDLIQVPDIMQDQIRDHAVEGVRWLAVRF